ncbi:MAG: radical SAM protein [Candidatus Pacearchaeota archaeon]
MIDILFVNPPSPNDDIYIRDICRVGRKSRENMIWPQTSLAQLAAMVYPKFKVGIIDCIAENIKWDKFEEYLKKNKPKYYITHVTAPTLTNDMYGVKIAKKFGAITISIGTHSNAVIKDTLIKFPSLDFIIIGEPELTLKELIETLDKKKSVAKIKGIAYKKNNKIKINPERPFIKNLDDLPIPIYKLLPLNKYRMPIIGKKYVWLLSNRGCPNSCTFCIQKSMWKGTVRHKSPERILKEIKVLHNLGVNNILFQSDLFTQNREMVIKLCKLIVNSGLKVRWACNSRVDTLNEEMLYWMKKAGCFMIALGIESCNQQILNNVKKGITIEQIKNAVRIINNAGIKVWGYFIIGLPGETWDTVKETVNIAKKLKMELTLWHIAVPYAGTEFNRQAKKNKWLINENWEEFDMNESTAISYPHMSAKEIIKATKWAYMQWYARPSVIIQLAKYAINPYNIRYFIKNMIKHIIWTNKK